MLIKELSQCNLVLTLACAPLTLPVSTETIVSHSGEADVYHQFHITSSE